LLRSIVRVWTNIVTTTTYRLDMRCTLAAAVREEASMKEGSKEEQE
jgi:hypothetical protein